ncbi:LLM class flavin-dependent oxidoreductase, partial [Actinoplanes sp. NPDC051633]
VVGATGPKTLRLSGEIADATILTSDTSVDGVRTAREHIGVAGHRVIMFAETATGPTAGQRVKTPSAMTGDAAAIAAGVRAFVEAGADTVVLEPTADEPDLPGFIRFVAQEVRPLVD